METFKWSCGKADPSHLPNSRKWIVGRHTDVFLYTGERADATKRPRKLVIAGKIFRIVELQVED